MGFGTAEGTFLPVAEKCVDSQIFSLAWIPSSARFCTIGTDIKGIFYLSVDSSSIKELHFEIKIFCRYLIK